MEKINRVGCLRVIKLGTSRNPPVLLLLHCIDLIPFDDGIILIQPALGSSSFCSTRSWKEGLKSLYQRHHRQLDLQRSESGNPPQ